MELPEAILERTLGLCLEIYYSQESDIWNNYFPEEVHGHRHQEWCVLLGIRGKTMGEKAEDF